MAALRRCFVFLFSIHTYELPASFGAMTVEMKTERPRFFAMCCEEPFRMFFPLGLAIGMIGLALWPLHLLGASMPYPAVMHSRLMIEGFMAAFIIGFLG